MCDEREQLQSRGRACVLIVSPIFFGINLPKRVLFCDQQKVGSIPVWNFCENVVKKRDKEIIVYKCKKYGDFRISGRLLAIAGLVFSNTTEARKKGGKSWVRIWKKVILFVCTLESVSNITLLGYVP